MTIESLHAALKERIAGRLTVAEDLSRLTTYRLGGPAALYMEPGHIGDLEILSEALAQVDVVPILPLGRGSNLVISDVGWPGLVVRLGAGFSDIRPGGDEEVVVGGAVTLPQLSNWTARRGLAGMEFAIAIPGSLGGGVRMDAGAHGSDIGETIKSAVVFDLSTGSPSDRSAAALGLSYRQSSITDTELILEASFELRADDPARVRGRVDEYRRHRATTQPPALQNAGSVFKNPPGDHAGRLVEAAGLKGFSVGTARVSELHANFFIATGDASAQDVYDLVQQVRERVAQTFGITLEPEVRFVGEFRTHSSQGRVE